MGQNHAKMHTFICKRTHDEIVFITVDHDDTYMLDADVVNGELYAYCVISLDSDDPPIDFSDKSFNSITYWVSPSFTHIPNSQNGVKLNWNFNGADKYIIYRSIGNSAENANWEIIGIAPAYSLRYIGLKKPLFSTKNT